VAKPGLSPRGLFCRRFAVFGAQISMQTTFETVKAINFNFGT